jgi:hypothetical protein
MTDFEHKTLLKLRQFVLVNDNSSVFLILIIYFFSYKEKRSHETTFFNINFSVFHFL